MKLVILVILATYLTLSAAMQSDDEKCSQAAELFVKEYNAGDNHVYYLERVTACWTVGDDLHVSLTMTFDHKYINNVLTYNTLPCVNVITKSTLREQVWRRN